MIQMPRVAAVLAALVLAPVVPAAAAVSPVHHAIEVRLDPESGRLEIFDIVTLSGRTDLDFQLAQWLAVDHARIDGRPAKVTGIAGAWRVPLPDTGEHRIELSLRGVLPPLPPAGGRNAALQAASGPEGSYLPGYANWIPATGDDWIAYRLTVELPAPYRAVATGRLGQERLGETINRVVFAADYPAEPPSVFAGPYKVRQRRHGDIRLRTYFHPELADLAEDYLRDAGRYLESFQDQIGPYPFRDFHIVSAPLPVGLGFPNLTYIGRTVLPLPFIRGRSLAHEVLHNCYAGDGLPDRELGDIQVIPMAGILDPLEEHEPVMAE